MNKRQELYPTISRTSPVLFLYITLLNCIVNPSYNSFYLLICYYSILGSNWIIKHFFFKPDPLLVFTNSHTTRIGNF